MALVLANRVRDSTTTTGTGTITLANSPPAGYQAFSVIGDTNTTFYTIQGDTTEWEIGIGTYATAGPTLARTTVLASSNGGSLVPFSAGTKQVFVDMPSSKALYVDASGNAIALGTPASVTLTNATGLPISTGVSGLGTGVATALGVNIGLAGAPVLFNGALGTPSSGTATNITGLPVGGISATGTPTATTALLGNGTWTAIPTSIAGTANQIAASAATGAVTLSIPTNPTLPGFTTSDGFSPTGSTATGNRFYLAAENTPAFSQNSNEIMRFNTSAQVLIGTTSGTGGGKLVVSHAASNEVALNVRNSAASNPYGQSISFTGAAPNDTTRWFVQAVDTGGERFTVRSNGGIANYSANNVNLSDERVKNEFQSINEIDGLLTLIWNAHRDVRWARYKYEDQSHNDWNFGYGAGDIEIKFSSCADSLISDWVEKTGERRVLKAVHQEDLHNIGHAVLSEAQRRVEQLEQRLAEALLRIEQLENQ